MPAVPLLAECRYAVAGIEEVGQAVVDGHAGESRLYSRFVLDFAMKLKGFTDTADWHPRTLLAMACDPSAWDCGATWKEWHLRFDYAWYDGPIFQWRAGPFWVCLHY